MCAIYHYTFNINYDFNKMKNNVNLEIVTISKDDPISKHGSYPYAIPLTEDKWLVSGQNSHLS